MTSLSRRAFLGTAAAGTTLAATAAPKTYQSQRSPWPLCLDTATIRPEDLEGKVRIARDAGYDAIEPWEGELREYEEGGGNLADLGKAIAEAGLFVPSVIGLWDAIPATPEAFEAQWPATRARMRMAQAIGAQQIQVIPGPRREAFDPVWAAQCYRKLLEVGRNDYGLRPALVFVAFLPGCKRLGQAAQIALDTDHPEAAIIPDVFHMHIGGSGFRGLRHLSGDFIAIFQFNDAPADPPRDELKDHHRVFPGDGILPLEQSLRDLRDIGYTGCISLELYNRDYWERDLADVAKEGRDKTLAVIERALA